MAKKSKQYEFSHELETKDAAINFRLSGRLLKRLRACGRKLGLDDQKLIRLAIHEFVKTNEK